MKFITKYKSELSKMTVEDLNLLKNKIKKETDKSLEKEKLINDIIELKNNNKNQIPKQILTGLKKFGHYVNKNLEANEKRVREVNKQ